MDQISAYHPHGIRVSASRRVFLAANTIILLAISFIMLYPVLYVIAASFSEETAILRGDVVFIPVDAHVKAYQKVFQYPLLWQSYGNTLLYTGLGTVINLVLTVFGAWALSQKKMVGRRFFTLMCTFTMFFNGGMIPTFLVIRELRLLNTLSDDDYAVTTQSGLKEVCRETGSGRIDMMVAAGEWIYVIEFKLNKTADDAMQQIENKDYALKYRKEDYRIMLVGVNFDFNAGNISNWLKEEYCS